MYSQYDEEEQILAATAGVPSARFLDLGAFHPTKFSNTRALVEQGWSGVFVDVSPSAVRALTAEYGGNPRFSVVQCAVSVEGERSFAEIHATDDALSTLDPATVQKWSATGGYYGKFLAPAIPVREILRQVGDDFQFVNIDIEGISVPILHELLPGLARKPACICLEYDDELERVRAWSAENGYEVASVNGTNVVLRLL